MMNRSTITVVAWLALMLIAAYEASPTESVHSHRSQFKAQYGDRFANPAEETKRVGLFAKNKLKMDKGNMEKSKEAGHKLAVNHLSGRNEDEFGSKHLLQLHRRGPLSEGLRKIIERDEPVPDSLDWRQHGRVTPVKDQGKCNCDWVFSAIGVLEGQLLAQKKANETISLSAQNIMDCGSLSSRDPCAEGGAMLALYDVSQTAGVESEADYPYEAAKGQCKYNKSLAVIKNANYDVLKPNDEELVRTAVARYGPVSVTIKVDLTKGKFKDYKSGVYSDEHCHDGVNYVNLALLVVGYGTDPEQGDYWIVKNSWSKAWGEGGYIRMARHKNLCDIAQFPILATF